MENNPRIQQLIGKYLNKSLAEGEKEELLNYFQDPAFVLEIEARFGQEFEQEEGKYSMSEIGQQQLLENVFQPQKSNPSGGISKKLWIRTLIAAAIAVMVISVGIWFLKPASYPTVPNTTFANDVAPGKNTAVLTLANGRKIVLSGAKNGELANQAGVKVTKTADGQIVYNSSLPSGISPQRGERGAALNTITTPRGGQYQVHLPDGTHVWLNAASTLKYPITFTGSTDRKVSLTGEAYFEVAKDKTHPFKVTSTTQEVTVLGTHFNINTYPDEPDTKTTLLEGSVKVTAMLSMHPASLAPSGRGGKAGEGKESVLKPNQQSTLKNGSIQVKTVNPSDAIAWKNGEFVFTGETLESIMRKVSRWYDVKIDYTNNTILNTQFSGSVSRFDNLSELLQVLQSTGLVKFTISGKTITVSQK